MLGNTRLQSARAPSALRLGVFTSSRSATTGEERNENGVSYIRRHGLVHGAPPDVFFRRVLLDDSLV